MFTAGLWDAFGRILTTSLRHERLCPDHFTIQTPHAKLLMFIEPIFFLTSQVLAPKQTKACSKLERFVLNNSLQWGITC